MFRTQCVLALVALYVGLAQSWEFAVTAGDRIEFYTDLGIKTDTVHFGSQNLTALAYDEVHNMLLYVDKQRENDAICGYNISSVEYKCYIERSGRDVQGLAFDPITEILFFTDTKERSINWISINTGTENNVNGHLLIKMSDGIPTDIAVDSCKGYIYWVNANFMRSTIERARFNGSEREVVIDASYDKNLHSLAIDQQTQKIYWLMHRTNWNFLNLFRADMSGQNKKSLIDFYFTADHYDDKKFSPPNKLTISKDFLFMLEWCSTYRTEKTVQKFHKLGIETKAYYGYHIQSFVGIAAKNKIREQIQGDQDCKGQTSLVPNSSYLKALMTNNTFKIAREYVEPFCDHGIKVNGQSHCKCTPGYIGKRCDVSVCENYCVQGNCTFNEEGLPKCRCNTVYSGERCEVNACRGFCLNKGTCSLNADSEPVCQCIGDYLGDRCEVTDCLNYCLQGDCSFNEEGVRECRCNAGYSGKRCEVNACHGYCVNNGTCSLNADSEPVCQCIGDYLGDRCEVSDCLNYCLQGDCSFNEEGVRECRCNAGYSGERCEVNACHGYCVNNGTCSLNADSKPVCQCIGDYLGDRCEVSDCLNYCLQGDCSFNEEGVRECRCNAGYSGERCEVNVCHGYCMNNGTCSLNADSEPVCQCIGDYLGDRCEVSDCLNYCLQGDCSFNEEGVPECRCNAGYSGERCEVNACHGYCLNKGTCSLNADSEPVCQCIGDYLGDRCEVSDCLNYCLQGDCSFNEEGVPECRCNAGYSGERCEVNVCHGYCLNNGTCSLNEKNEPVCQCIDDYAGDRCDVTTVSV